MTTEEKLLAWQTDPGTMIEAELAEINGILKTKCGIGWGSEQCKGKDCPQTNGLGCVCRDHYEREQRLINEPGVIQTEMIQLYSGI